MLKRTVTALVGLAFVIPILYFSDTYAFVAFIALLSFIASYEMLGCIGQRNELAVSIPFYLISILIPMISRAFENVYIFCSVALGIMFVYTFYLFALSVFTRGRYLVKDAALSVALCTYIVIAFVSLILLRDMEGIGKYVYLMPFVGSWASDIFAYVCGCLFGKHKLIPEVSPKKTVEGLLGGIVFAMLAFCLYGFVISKMYNIVPNYFAMLILGAVVSLVSQLGDLIASIIKRQFGIKDYGKLLPGHGGVMDRFDSMLAVSPFLFIMISAVLSFTTLFA